jgi:transcriptional antiterminator NusG
LGVEKTAEGEDNIINTVTEVAFSEGDLVTITEGLMEGNSGVVESIDAANSTVRVIVSFMGKEAPVELPLSQVTKAID